MAKQKKETAEEAETNRSIGSLMKGKETQRERNAAVKEEMINNGDHPKAKRPIVRTQRERNLALKAQLKNESENEKGKSKK